MSYALQSSEVKIGGTPRPVAMEQLPCKQVAESQPVTHLVC